MASCKLVWQYADGNVALVKIKTKSKHPDAIADIASEAVRSLTSLMLGDEDVKAITDAMDAGE